MREVLQIIGQIFAIIVVIVMNIGNILKFNSSKKDELADAWLIEGIFRASAFGIITILIFVLLSLLF